MSYIYYKKWDIIKIVHMIQCRSSITLNISFTFVNTSIKLYVKRKINPWKKSFPKQAGVP
jgi:hypothetical protein